MRAVCLVASALMADDKAEVDGLIRGTAESLTAVFRQEGLTKTDKLAKVIKIVEPIFDYKSMSMLTLGRTNWKRLDDAQHKEFYGLFIKQLERAYFDKAEYLTESDLQIDAPVAVKSKMHVATHVSKDGKPVTVKYKLYKTAGQWMVYDVEVAGVSLISSYRSQYAEILKDGTPAELLAAMRAKANEMQAE